MTIAEKLEAVMLSSKYKFSLNIKENYLHENKFEIVFIRTFKINLRVYKFKQKQDIQIFLYQTFNNN